MWPQGRVGSSPIFRIFYVLCLGFLTWRDADIYAEVAELADAHGSGPCGGNTLWVQVPSSAVLLEGASYQRDMVHFSLHDYRWSEVRYYMKNKYNLLFFAAISMLAVCICVSCGKKAEEAEPTITQEETNTGVTPKPIDVLLGESEDDLFVMNESEQYLETASEIFLPTYIYYASKDFTHLMLVEEELAQKNEDIILSALARHNIVTLDTKVNSFSVVVTEEGKVRVALDLNSKFAKYLQTMAEKSEEIILASVTNTFLDNYDADELLLTVEGMPLKTSHNTYKEPFTRYDIWAEAVAADGQ